MIGFFVVLLGDVMLQSGRRSQSLPRRFEDNLDLMPKRNGQIPTDPLIMPGGVKLVIEWASVLATHQHVKQMMICNAKFMFVSVYV